MEDKLTKKRYKIHYMRCVEILGFQEEFSEWKKDKKIKSQNRLAYMYLKHIDRLEFCRLLDRLGIKDRQQYVKLIRVCKTEWMKEID